MCKARKSENILLLWQRMQNPLKLVYLKRFLFSKKAGMHFQTVHAQL